MSISTSNLDPMPKIDPAIGSADRPAPSRAAVEKIAHEFEAMLMLQMVRQMRQGLLEEQSADEGFGAATMTDTFDQEFTRYLSSVGGLGVSRILQEHLPVEAGAAKVPAADLHVGDPTRLPGPVAAATLRPATTPVVGQVSGGQRAGAPLELPLDAPISSAFGWRTDPFVGSTRFHGGIDMKAAYGRVVPTAAPGRVTFAGEQGAYGQTVVVEHAGGYQTRYAHLSSIAVSAGQQIAVGEVVGRVGRSGRATGPHLHFEVSRDGKKLDPVELARTFAERFKIQETPVDLSVDSASEQALSIGADHEG